MWDSVQVICEFRGWSIPGESYGTQMSAFPGIQTPSTYRFCMCSLVNGPRLGSEHSSERERAWVDKKRTLMTFSSFSGPFTPRIESLCSSWTKWVLACSLHRRRNFVPINPLKRLKVRGIRTCGFTSISTPLAVLMYT